jgi:putative transposase
MSFGHRRSVRLEGYDYSQAGLYFVTICSQDGSCLFGCVLDAVVQLTPAGTMVRSWWEKIPEKFPGAELDSFEVMPNHLHGIIDLFPGRSDLDDSLDPPLGRVIAWFKTMTTNEYFRGVKNLGWPRAPARLWQRSYWDHVIRTEEELGHAREYIDLNPARWEFDLLNRAHRGVLKKRYRWEM